jgi:hypothetical protein
MKSARASVTFETEIAVPDHFTEEEVQFFVEEHLCASDIIERFLKAHDAHCCCGLAKITMVHRNGP